MDLVQDTMKIFNDFSIEAVPREENCVVLALVISTSTLQPCEVFLQDLCNMEVVFIPLVLDNLEHWKVFDDDSQILRSMQGTKEFSDS
jgi:hypothetical protein